MSYNQSRSDKNDTTQYRKSDRRSASSNQQRGSSGAYVKGGGPAPSPSYVLSSGRSLKRNNNNAQGGQSRASVPTVNSSSLESSNVSTPRSAAVQNGSHVQPQFHGASDMPVTSPAAKPAELSAPQRSNRTVPKVPTSQPASMSSDSTAPRTPIKAPGDASKAFSFQFGSISPGFMNGMQVPARTSSAPPNLDEQKRDQARHDSFRSAAPLPTPSAPKQQLPRKDAGAVNQPNTGEAYPVSKAKKDAQVSPAPPASQQQKPPGLPMTGISMPMPFHQSQVSVQYGGPNQQLQSQGMTAAASLQMPLHMPLAMGNPPQVQPPVFVQGLQPHPMQTRGIIHQGQGLSFTTQMGPPQLPPQLSSMGITMSPQYSQQQGGKFGVQRKTSVKITHLHHSNGSSQPIPSYAPSHTMSFYTPNSYNTSPIYYPPQSSVPLTSSPMAPSSQVPRFNYQVGQGPQNMTFMNPALSSLPVNKTGTQMHGVADLPNLEHSHDLHTIISSALSTTIPVTVKPSAGSIGEKVADSMRPNSTHGAEKGESPKHSVSIPSYGTKQLVIANPKSKIVQSAHCEVCKINCNSKCVLDTHKLGKKHKKNLEKLNKANEVTASAQSSAESDNPAIGPQEPPDIGDKGEAVDLQNSRKKAAEPVEDLETKRQKVLRGGAGAEVVWRCALCNVVCSSKTGFLSHLAGQKHALTINKHKLARKHKENLEKLNKANKAAAATYKNKATASAQSFAESNYPAIGPQEPPDIGDKGEVVDLQNSRKKAAEPVEDLETKRRKVLQGGSVAEAVRTCNV